MLKITERAKKLWKRLRDKEYREAFVEGAINDSVAVQIYSMRQDRGWTQQYLADRLDTKQAAISRLEGGDNPPTLKNLLKIASAFDVALMVRFVPFSEFLIGDDKPIDRSIPAYQLDKLEASRAPTGSSIILTDFRFSSEEPSRIFSLAQTGDTGIFVRETLQ